MQTDERSIWTDCNDCSASCRNGTIRRCGQTDCLATSRANHVQTNVSVSVRRADGQRESPQIALAIALGIAIGILPKGNLIAVLFVVLLFTLRTNLAAGLLSAAICSWIGVGLDPISHRVGEAVLTFGPLQGLFAGLYRLPYAPWLSFNNTVVMGGLLIGLLQMPLTYFWCRRMFADRQTPQPERPAVPPPKMKRSSREQRRYVIGGDGAS